MRNFFTKKCILKTKGTETEHTPGRSIGYAMKSNFKNLCKCKNVFIFRKRSKCLVFKINGKAVRTTLPKFNLMNQAFRT